jgi:hypothetical protein
MDGARDETWKTKRLSVTQQMEKLQEGLGRMDEIDARMESRIDRLKALAGRTETLTQPMLGALEKEDAQHEIRATTKEQPMPLKKKGKMVESYFCSCNHLVRDCPLQGKLARLIEVEEA